MLSSQPGRVCSSQLSQWACPKVSRALPFARPVGAQDGTPTLQEIMIQLEGRTPTLQGTGHRAKSRNFQSKAAQVQILVLPLTST